MIGAGGVIMLGVGVMVFLQQRARNARGDEHTPLRLKHDKTSKGGSKRNGAGKKSKSTRNPEDTEMDALVETETVTIEVKSARKGAKTVTTAVALECAAARSSARAAMRAALLPWLGEKILDEGFRIYVHEDDVNKVLLTGLTPLRDVVEAASVEVILDTKRKLPTAPPPAGGASTQSGNKKGKTKKKSESKADESLPLTGPLTGY